MLVLREVMNPAYGLFHEDEESHLIWFSDSLVRRGARGKTLTLLSIHTYIYVYVCMYFIITANFY